MNLEDDYKALEALQETFNKAQKVYYQTRYLFWGALHSIKKHSSLKVPYKRFEARVRNDCKKKQRKGEYGKRGRGQHLDHFYFPVIWFYCNGIDDLNLINSKLNCKWMKRKDNIHKGIRCANQIDLEFDATELKQLKELIK
jgi:hypothetical protein